MKRSAGRAGLVAVAVESLGGLALLLLLFPLSPLPAHDATKSIPLLQIPAPISERELAADASLAVARNVERRQFVERELDISSRALVALFDRHVQKLFGLSDSGAECSASR